MSPSVSQSVSQSIVWIGWIDCGHPVLTQSCETERDSETVERETETEPVGVRVGIHRG